eukprot:TRINITY_DN44400_c0_g1_i1.p1 TRINITY_DN44400_c0_g1~~TRINITY_DN44400_c0_g1_i1.p1  ORF type:complete len:360 (+),score=38.02 TRINITY_DN44400_c0_g1_i1:89-1168(+)
MARELTSDDSQGLTMLYHPSDDGGGVERSHGRGDTMFLDPIRPADVPRGRMPAEKPNWTALRTDDILGAQPRNFHTTLSGREKPPMPEVPGSRTRLKQYRPEGFDRGSVPPDLCLVTYDIAYAQPKHTDFKTSRCLNPLMPRYELPGYTKMPPEVPKQVFHEGVARDTLSFKGHWHPRVPVRNYENDPLQVRDINGTLPNQKNRLDRTNPERFTPRETMRMNIQQAGQRTLSTMNPMLATTPRATNPLDPEYKLHTKTTHPLRQGEENGSALAPRHAGAVDGAAPRVLHKDNGEPQASLIRRDIGGAVPQRYKGAMPFNIYDPPEVTPFGNHLGLHCADIEKAQTGSRTPGTMWTAVWH